MWNSFKYHGREFEWRIVTTPAQRIEVRSQDGDYHVHALIHENNSEPRQIKRNWILAPTFIGTEFPVGCRMEMTPPISLDGGIEIAEHGIIHTDLVRSLIGRWENRAKYKSSISQVPGTVATSSIGLPDPRLKS